MAETFWHSSGSDVWNSAANWNNGVPGVGDVAIFDGRSSVSVGGADRSAGGTLTRIRIHPKYKGNIGSPGNPLIIPVSNVDHLGSGQVCIKQVVVTNASVLVNSKHDKRDDALQWTGFNPAYLDILRGRMMLNAADGAAGPIGLVVHGGSLRVASTNKNIGWLMVHSGEAVIECVAAAAYVEGGRLTKIGGTHVDVIISGGKYIAQTDVTNTGATWLLGGTFDISQCTGAFVLPYLTIYPAADFIYNQESYAGVVAIRDLRNDFP